MDLLWRLAISKGTASAYNSALQAFHTFIKFYQPYAPIGQLPDISEDLIIKFVTHCSQNLNLKWSTIKLYVSGLRFHYIKAGINSPFSNMDRLHYIMSAIRRKQGYAASSNRYPITFPILYSMCSLLKAGVFSPYTDIMLTCVIQLAFFGFLRCGEFTVLSSQDYDKCIRIQDIWFNSDHSGFILHLRNSKTDPFHKGVDIHIFANKYLCPVSTMRKFIQIRTRHGSDVTSPLFMEYNNTVLTRSAFISYLRHMLTRLGKDDSAYCGHSFRIGAATSAAAAGVEDHLIQTMGRWSSDCYVRYIKTSDCNIRKAQTAMCVS